MLPESKNIKIIADNIRALENRVNELDVEIPPHTSTDSGKVLAVDSEGELEWKTEYPYAPPAYSSTEEVNTGQKWIDGKDIYMVTKTWESITEGVITFDLTDCDIDHIVNVIGSLNAPNFTCLLNYYSSSTSRFASNYSRTNKSLGVATGTTTNFLDGSGHVTIYYTKVSPTPSPSTETKSKKGGTKK